MLRPYFVLITLSALVGVSGCSAVMQDSVSTETQNVTPDVAEETLEESGETSETEPEEETVETVVEENTPDVIDEIISAMRASETRASNSGFFEYREGLNKSTQTEFEYVAILSPAEPGSIYFYDSRMGFSQITKLLNQQIQSDYGFAQQLNLIDTLQTNNSEPTEFYTFQRETTGDSQTYVLISNLDETNIKTEKFTITDGLITSSTTTDNEYTFDTTYEYVISETVQNYMNNAFDPEAPTVVEEN